MLRRLLILALLLPCLASSAFAQFKPSLESGSARGAKPARPTTIKPAPGIVKGAKSASPTDAARCDIGVIPIAGNLFLIEKFGLIRFDDTVVRAAANGWELDDLVVSRVRAAARGAVVRRIVFSREELARSRASASFFRSINLELRDFARQVAAGTNCERYVMVHRAGGGKNPYGIGIAKFVSPMNSRTFLFVLMHVRVYDGRTFELIKEAAVRNSDESLLARAYLNPVGGPYRELNERSFPASREEVAANPVLRDGVRVLLTEGLDKTLPTVLGPPTE
jgi:hypothetical protein